MLTFASLLGIFYISGFIDLSDKLFRGSATAGLMLRYFAFETPHWCTHRAAVGVDRHAGHDRRADPQHELIVMRACGISLYRVALPLLVMAAASSVLLFGLRNT